MEQDPGPRDSLEELFWQQAAARYADITGSAPTPAKTERGEPTPRHPDGPYTLRARLNQLQRRALGIPSWEPDTY